MCRASLPSQRQSVQIFIQSISVFLGVSSQNLSVFGVGKALMVSWLSSVLFPGLQEFIQGLQVAHGIYQRVVTQDGCLEGVSPEDIHQFIVDCDGVTTGQVKVRRGGGCYQLPQEPVVGEHSSDSNLHFSQRPDDDAVKDLATKSWL